MQLVILAAGMGSRFGGLKQMEPMDDYGNFIIDYSIVDAKKAGFDEVIFIIKRELLDAFQETIGKRVEKLIKVKYAFQELEDLPEGFTCPEGREKPWGTGHAILAARDLINDKFIIINGDDFYGEETYKVAAEYLKSLPAGSKGKYANVGFYAKNTMTENGSVKRGVCFQNDQGFLTKMVESSLEYVNGDIKATPLSGEETFTCEKDRLVSMNLFAFTPDVLDYIGEQFVPFLEKEGTALKSEYLIPTIISDMVNDGKATLQMLESPAVWFGVTYKEDKPVVVKAIKELTDKGVYKVGLY